MTLDYVAGERKMKQRTLNIFVVLLQLDDKEHIQGSYNPLGEFLKFLFSPTGLLLIALCVVVVGVMVKSRRKKKEVKVTEAISGQVDFKNAKVLIICPFCGAKTEQGISLCCNCGAKL